jgi:hypothetical protein
MYHQRLDMAMLAQAMGKFKWQIRRHFNINTFEKLSDTILLEYADVLGIDIKTLKSLSKY